MILIDFRKVNYLTLINKQLRTKQILQKIMIENENTIDKSEKSSEEQGAKAKRSRRRSRQKPRQQSLQEALGIGVEKIQDVEEKLFIARFVDYFSEDTLDFIYKDKGTDQYVKKMTDKIAKMDQGNEEDKLLKMSFEDKNLIQTIYDLKANAESIASNKGIKNSPDKRLRRLSLALTVPLVVLIFLLSFLSIDIILLFPILCIFCMLPQFLRGYVLKKWFAFKEENKNEVYTQNREDIMVLKSFVGELLNNIRAKLLEEKVPLQLIKFILHSQDYENLKLLNTQKVRGLTQYYFSFEYPEGMEPFPVPENLKAYEDRSFEKQEKPEKNFIILTELKAQDGVIESFVPSLREDLAEKINKILDESEFSASPKEFDEIIPNYSNEMAIYCVCGEIVEISDIQISNWKEQFKFYLFEGKECKCGETVYAISLMDDSTEIPEELKEIFL